MQNARVKAVNAKWFIYGETDRIEYQAQIYINIVKYWL